MCLWRWWHRIPKFSVTEVQERTACSLFLFRGSHQRSTTSITTANLWTTNRHISNFLGPSRLKLVCSRHFQISSYLTNFLVPSSCKSEGFVSRIPAKGPSGKCAAYLDGSVFSLWMCVLRLRGLKPRFKMAYSLGSRGWPTREALLLWFDNGKRLGSTLLIVLLPTILKFLYSYTDAGRGVY